MSQLCLQAEGGQRQPSSVFLFYLITQWVMPIHTGWSIWFALSTSSNANLFWNCSRHTEVMLLSDNQISWHPWPGQVDTELTNTEAVYKGVSKVKRKPCRIMQDPGMFLSPLGLRGTIAWTQKEELKLEGRPPSGSHGLRFRDLAKLQRPRICWGAWIHQPHFPSSL